ncbi:hypothetical protein CLPUN_09640 [Clostridium puniceum]|uniref:Uncharacterized protein n=1 Tax=Clostridium puniceum TaxID=29367 RepID=A0A1S8TVM7_9CLOT|nr:hypothetical protein [Clostridium puniceum]OOM81780.1 hypothetical protein CLPUN_09640 [Clostridium puniceum]
MSDYVQITLIICGTVIFIQLFGFYIVKSFCNNKQETRFKKDVMVLANERFLRCKSPTYPRPGTSSKKGR